MAVVLQSVPLGHVSPAAHEIRRQKPDWQEWNGPHVLVPVPVHDLRMHVPDALHRRPGVQSSSFVHDSLHVAKLH